MKTRAHSRLLLATLCVALAAPLTIAASFQPENSYQLGAVERYGSKVVQPGASAIQVAAFLGQPDQRLSGDTWVYRKFKSEHIPGQAADCTILVITFQHDRVSELRKVNAQTVLTIAAQLAAPATSGKLVARK